MIQNIDKNINLPNYVKTDGSSVSIDEGIFKERYEKLAKLILMWESILVISSTLLFYIVIQRALEKEKKYKEFLELMITTISHKFGNFIAAIKINIEILKDRHSKEVVKNSEDYINQMDKDLKMLIDILKKAGEEREEKVSIDKLVGRIVDSLKEKDRRVILQLRDFKLKTDLNVIENVLFILIDNAFRYSEKFVHIKSFIDGSLIIRNDIKHRSGGSGIGLLLAQRLAKTQNWDIKTRQKGNIFSVYIKF